MTPLPARLPLRRDCLAGAAALLGLVAAGPLARAAAVRKERAADRPETPPPTRPPLEPADPARLPAGCDRFDLFLLIGQSNMKGRGVMPAEPTRDERILMMHLRDDAWYLARHPLHLVGDARTFAGHDNAGVGPGLAFAATVARGSPGARIGLIPCAVGGSSIVLWQRGARLYDHMVRRARLALRPAGSVRPKLRGALWLQGEADATDVRLPGHEEKLLRLVDDLRADLGEPALPFIACTIGEMRADGDGRRNADLNRLLLSLPQKRPHTACVDARDLKGHIGDSVHFDTAAQEEIGRRYAARYLALVGG
jgi:hypothetical protein